MNTPLLVPLLVGSIKLVHGKPLTIGAVGNTGGERYYWLVDRNGDVAMLPWFCVEDDD